MAEPGQTRLPIESSPEQSRLSSFCLSIRDHSLRSRSFPSSPVVIAESGSSLVRGLLARVPKERRHISNPKLDYATISLPRERVGEERGPMVALIGAAFSIGRGTKPAGSLKRGESVRPRRKKRKKPDDGWVFLRDRSPCFHSRRGPNHGNHDRFGLADPTGPAPYPACSAPRNADVFLSRVPRLPDLGHGSFFRVPHRFYLLVSVT